MPQASTKVAQATPTAAPVTFSAANITAANSAWVKANQGNPIHQAPHVSGAASVYTHNVSALAAFILANPNCTFKATGNPTGFGTGGPPLGKRASLGGALGVTNPKHTTTNQNTSGYLKFCNTYQLKPSMVKTYMAFASGKVAGATVHTAYAPAQGYNDMVAHLGHDAVALTA